MVQQRFGIEFPAGMKLSCSKSCAFMVRLKDSTNVFKFHIFCNHNTIAPVLHQRIAYVFNDTPSSHKRREKKKLRITIWFKRMYNFKQRLRDFSLQVPFLTTEDFQLLQIKIDNAKFLAI